MSLIGCPGFAGIERGMVTYGSGRYRSTQPQSFSPNVARALQGLCSKREVIMPANKLKEYLDNHKIKYVTIDHSLAYTAQEIAAAADVPGKELAKTIIVKIDGELAMAVLPASFWVDTELLKIAARAKKIEIASEDEFNDLFPGCELGAMPPFGNLYRMKVFVAEKLAEDKEIVFNACTHRELIRLSYRDFEKLVKPVVANFAIS